MQGSMSNRLYDAYIWINFKQQKHSVTDHDGLVVKIEAPWCCGKVTRFVNQVRGLGFDPRLLKSFTRGPMTIFQDKLLTRTYCGEAGDYDVPNMLSPRDGPDLVFRPDLSDINLTTI